VQPLSGAWLIFYGGFAWNDYWLVLTYALYVLAGACWLPVVAIQIRMKAMLEARRKREARLSMRQNAGVCFAGGSCSVGRPSPVWWLCSGSW